MNIETLAKAFTACVIDIRSGSCHGEKFIENLDLSPRDFKEHGNWSCKSTQRRNCFKKRSEKSER